MILELVRIGHIDSTHQRHRILAEAMLVTLANAERLPLTLTLPTDPRAHRVAQTILANPAEAHRLDRIATQNGASLRTIQRRFAAETGLSLSEWRQAARLMAAAALLLDGKSVTEIALESGYASVSAFIHAFRHTLGMTPSAFRAAR